MKKYVSFLSILILLLVSTYVVKANELIVGNEIVSEVMDSGMYIDGENTLKYNGSPVGSSYILMGAPAGATFVWSIQGAGNCYCYPNNNYCSINVYSPGSYRLLCDVYVDGNRIDGVTIYITVTP